MFVKLTQGAAAEYAGNGEFSGCEWHAAAKLWSDREGILQVSVGEPARLDRMSVVVVSDLTTDETLLARVERTASALIAGQVALRGAQYDQRQNTSVAKSTPKPARPSRPKRPVRRPLARSPVKG